MPEILSASVIVVAKNASATIEKCLRSISAGSVPAGDYEVLVIDDRSTDDTVARVRENFPQVRVYPNQKRGPSAARNYGVQLARSAYIAFTDSDCIVEKKWLEKLLSAIRRGPYAGAGGVQDAPADESAFGRKVDALYKKTGFLTEYLKKGTPESLIKVLHNPSCCVMYRRDVFIREGGFLEDLYPGEDVEFDYLLTRRGYTLVFTPEAKVRHYRGDHLRGFLRKMNVYGSTQGRLVRTYGFFRKIHWLPLLNAGVLAGLALAGKMNLAAAAWVLAFGLTAGILFFSFDFYLLFLALSGWLCWQAGFLAGLMKKLPRR